jgi:urease accessory protein
VAQTSGNLPPPERGRSTDERSEGSRVGVRNRALRPPPGSLREPTSPFLGEVTSGTVVPYADLSHVFAANRAVGRIAFAAHAVAGMTRRARLREAGALRLRCPGPPSPELEALIINTAGGVAGGDDFDIDIAVGAAARLVVTTAAAEKIYRSIGPDATIDVKLKVGAGAELAWLPRETILFDQARLKRVIDVDLAADARLTFVESMIFGRSGMGEVVEHGHLFDRWRIRRGGRLIHAEALQLDGTIASRLTQPAVAKGSVAIGTVLLVPGDDASASRVRALAAGFSSEVGVSAWNGFAVIRLCAADGAALRSDLLTIVRALRETPMPRLWLQ